MGKKKNNYKFLVWNINKTGKKVFDDLRELISSRKPKIIHFIVLIEADNADSSAFCRIDGYTEMVLSQAVKTVQNIRVFVKGDLHNKIKTLKEADISEVVEEFELPNFKDFNTPDPQVKVFKQTIIVRQYLRNITLQTFSLNLPDCDPILLVVIHFPSALFADPIDQLQKAFEYKRRIDALSAKYKNRVIITGDFNMTPYDPGMTEYKGFYANWNRDKALDDPREIFMNRHMSYYNPCWILLGDHDLRNKVNRNGGSFFYSKSFIEKKRDWHLIDQVIFTKPLLANFNHQVLELIKTDAIESEVLTNASTRGKKILYDHLPLYFEFNF